jgi:general secretion pathway protein D
LLANSSFVRGARVAGDNGPTPVTPGSKKEARAPAKVKPPVPLPAHKKPVRAKEKTAQEKSKAQEKKAPEEKPDKRYVTIDFDNVNITIFIKFISELTGKNFVIDKAVSAKTKITIISPTKISVEEAYRVFESVLEVYGLAAVPAGSITKIVSAASARSKNIETRLRKEAITPEDKVVTQLIPLRYADPNGLKKLLTPLISKNSLLVSYAPTGTLIVTDVLSNIKRLLRIIEAIDVEGIGEEISVIPLEYATASVMAKSLSTIFQRRSTKTKTGIAGSTAVKIASDERTNALIILASEDDTLKVKQLIELLDRETPRGEGDIHVYYLQNANAEDLAAVLKAIPKDQKAAEKKGKAPVISKEVQIVADKATNALVITANKADYLVLENVIKKLDIARRMVYIEALFMEVSVNKDFRIGVDWRVGKDIGRYDDIYDVGAFASSALSGGLDEDDEGKVSMPAGFALGVLGEAITIGDLTFPSIGALIQAVQGDSDIHILSTPQIMTTDNEEAEIVVAQNIPFITRQETTSTTDRDYSSYEFKDVGVTLNITPQINQERFVRLKILQEISQVVPDESTPLGLLTTLKRLTKTTVVIKDGHTIVIGGLVGETLSAGTNKVPCLGNIPGLGWLFKSFGSSGGKSNLYIFITPHIIENPEEAKEVYQEKKDAIEGVEEGVIKMYKRPGAKETESEVTGE